MANSAAYLERFLSPGQKLLDIGCGPGTLTVDLARRIAPGRVTAIDVSDEVLAEATAAASGVATVSFQVGDVYSLPSKDDLFDVVHAHQVLQHLEDPVAALREMRRVARPGGIIAVRDSDYGAMTWYPPSTGLDLWNDVYHRLAHADGNEPDAGRHLLRWFLEAGFSPEDLRPSASIWSYATDEERHWWGDMWAERSRASRFADQAKQLGLATAEQIEGISAAWRTWAEQPDGCFIVPHGEIVARVR